MFKHNFAKLSPFRDPLDHVLFLSMMLVCVGVWFFVVGYIGYLYGHTL